MDWWMYGLMDVWIEGCIIGGCMVWWMYGLVDVLID